MLPYLKYPKIVTGIVIAITILAAIQLPRLQLENDARDSFMPHEDISYKRMLQSEDDFVGSYVIGVSLETSKHSILSADNLSIVKNIVDKLLEVDDIDIVDSVANIDYICVEDGGLVAKPLVDEDLFQTDGDKEVFIGTQDDLDAIQEKIVDWEDMYDRVILSDEGRATQIQIVLHHKHLDANGVETKVTGNDRMAVLKKVYNIVNTITAGSGLRVSFYGDTVTSDNSRTFMVSDLIRLIPLVAIVVLGTLFFSFKTIDGTILPLLTVIISTIWSCGLMAVFHIPFTIVSSIIPVALIAVGSAYGIHVLTHYYIALEKATSGGTKITRELHAQIITSGVKDVFVAVLLAGLTTMVGFISLVTSPLSSLHSFAIFTSLGVFFSLTLALIYIPCLLIMKPLSKVGQKSERMERLIARAKEKARERAEEAFEKANIQPTGIHDEQGFGATLYFMYRFLVGSKARLIVFSLAIVIFSIAGMRRIKIESSMINYFPPTSKVRQDADYVNQRFAGTNTIAMIVSIDDGVSSEVERNIFKKISNFFSGKGKSSSTSNTAINGGGTASMAGGAATSINNAASSTDNMGSKTDNADSIADGTGSSVDNTGSKTGGAASMAGGAATSINNAATSADSANSLADNAATLADDGADFDFAGFDDFANDTGADGAASSGEVATSSSTTGEAGEADFADFADFGADFATQDDTSSQAGNVGEQSGATQPRSIEEMGCANVELLVAMDGLQKYLLEKYPDIVGKIVSFTTSVKRMNAVMNDPYITEDGQEAQHVDVVRLDGKQYISPAQYRASLENLITANAFIEVLNKAYIEAGGKRASVEDIIDIAEKKLNYKGRGYYEIPYNTTKYPVASRDELSNLVSQYLMLLGGDTLRRFSSPIGSFAPRKLRAQIQLRSNNTTDSSVILAEAKKYAKEYFPAGYKVEFTGGGEIDCAMTDMILSSQITSLFLSLLSVFIIISISFKSPLAGILGVIPLGFTIMLNYMVMGFAGIRLDLVTSIIASVAVGIGIDYTIHFLETFHNERRSCQKMADVLKNTFNKSGVGIVTNALAVGLGFMVLCLSKFVVLQYVGILVAVVMFVSALLAMTIIPGVLHLGDPKFMKE